MVPEVGACCALHYGYDDAPDPQGKLVVLRDEAEDPRSGSSTQMWTTISLCSADDTPGIVLTT